jgi:hypothetical protein
MFPKIMQASKLFLAAYLMFSALLGLWLSVADEEVDTEHPTYCMKCGDYEGRI